jgi:tetratricopeptide (TPR) repeat protein
MKRALLVTLFIAMACSRLYATDLYEDRLNRGLKNAEFHSYYLIEKAHGDPDKVKEYLDEALKLSPDLPAAYFHLAWVTFTTSPENIYETANYLVGGVSAYKRNFWWLFNLAGVAYVSVLITVVCSLLLIVLVRLPIDMPLINHEIREDGKNFIVFILAFFISAMGPLYFIAAMLMLISFYFKKGNIILTYAFLGSLIFLPLLLKPVETFFSAALSSPLKAIVAVNQGEDNNYALYVLKGREGREELFSLALARKRVGDIDGAIADYRKVLEKDPNNAEACNNLGNCYAIVKSYADARDMYQKSAAIRPLASAYYNLSQISREQLDFEEGDKYFDEAKKTDPDAVSRFRALTSRTPNRFYIDETLDMKDFWNYALRLKGADIISTTFLPQWSAPVVGLMVLISFAVFFRVRRYRAYSCKRCGKIICAKCERSLKWGSMCHDCFTSLVTLERDPRDRIAKVMSVYETKRRRKNTIRLLSFIMPGLHLIYTGKIIKGALLMFFYLWLPILFLIGLHYRFTIYPFMHSWIVVILAVTVPGLYLLNIIATRRYLKTWV